MSRRISTVVLLCEDQQQEVFMRRFLKHQGYRNDQMRVKRAPEGKQSAEQFVRNRYPVELRAYRSLSGRIQLSLAVMIDADAFSVDERMREFDAACIDQDVAVRTGLEKVGVFVPKRNIETWIYFLQGTAIDEESAYRKMENPSDCEGAVRCLAEHCRQNTRPAGLPDSLMRAFSECRRI